MSDQNYWQWSTYSEGSLSGMAPMAFMQVNGVSPVGLMMTSSQTSTGAGIAADYHVEIGGYSQKVRPFIHY